VWLPPTNFFEEAKLFRKSAKRRHGTMTVHHEKFQVTGGATPAFYDVTERVKDIVSRSGVANGIVTVYSQHTTCSVMIQEESHDTLYDGRKYLLQDLLEVLAKVIPDCKREGAYLHPGPEHIKHAVGNLGEEAVWSLNTDAHLRSCLLGRSETIPIIDGKVELGEFGQVYFVDFDTVRERERNVHVQIVGE
jgi:secondary thiamine-phosphate synthase enzyme